MRRSKLFSCISFSTFCLSNIVSTNSVFAKNFKCEKNFLESFFSEVRKLKDLDENKFEKATEIFLYKLSIFSSKFKLLKSYDGFCAFIDNLDAIINGKLKVIACLKSLLQASKNDFRSLKKILKKAKSESKKDANNFASAIVNKVDEYIYGDDSESHEKSIDLHNLLGEMYGKTQKMAFSDQLSMVYKTVIEKKMSNKKIHTFIEDNIRELDIISDILKADVVSLFAACKFYNRLKNKNALKEELKINDFVQYLDENEKKELENSGSSSSFAYLVGSVEKFLLYPTAVGGIMQIIGENARYPLNNNFFKILVNAFKKGLPSVNIKKDSLDKHFNKKKHNLFGSVLLKNEENKNNNNKKATDDKRSGEKIQKLFKVVCLEHQETESLKNKKSNEELVDYNKKSTNKELVSSKEKVNLKDEIQEISDGFDLVHACLNLFLISEKPPQENIQQ